MPTFEIEISAYRPVMLTYTTEDAETEEEARAEALAYAQQLSSDSAEWDDCVSGDMLEVQITDVKRREDE